MFRYEDEVFGDSEPELDEGKLNLKGKHFLNILHSGISRSMELWGICHFSFS